MCLCVCVRVSTSTCTCVSQHVSACQASNVAEEQVRVCVCVCVCLSACVCVCVCVYAHAALTSQYHPCIMHLTRLCTNPPPCCRCHHYAGWWARTLTCLSWWQALAPQPFYCSQCRMASSRNHATLSVSTQNSTHLSTWLSYMLAHL